MKQQKLFRLLFVCLFGTACTMVSAQNASSQSSTGQSSGDAAKQQYYLTKKEADTKSTSASTQQQTKTGAPVNFVPTGGNLKAQLKTEKQATTNPSDRKQLLLQLKAAAAAKGLPTAKYDQELQQLTH